MAISPYMQGWNSQTVAKHNKEKKNQKTRKPQSFALTIGCNKFSSKKKFHSDRDLP